MPRKTNIVHVGAMGAVRKTTKAMSRTPVYILLGDFASGVSSWAFRLRAAFEAHPRYAVRLVNCHRTGNKLGRFDHEATTRPALQALFRRQCPALVVPNFVFEAFEIVATLVEEGNDLHSIGFCRADSEEEYYQPLRFYEPVIHEFAAVSPQCMARLGDAIPQRKSNIACMPTGVNVPPTLQRPHQCRPIRLIYAGRIVQIQKRVMDFVPLVTSLLKREVDFTFTIAGQGRDLDDLRRAVAEVPHQGRVHFPGAVAPQAMERLWKKQDVFVQVSDFEGTSNSMLESMAQGVVPVMTRTESGVADIIQQGENGFLVEVGDMDGMAEIINGLAKGGNAELAAIGQAAHETTHAYSMERYVDKFSDLLDRAMEAPLRSWPVDLPKRPDFPAPGLLLEDRAGGEEIQAAPGRDQLPSLSPYMNATVAPRKADEKRLLILFPSPLRGGAEEYCLTLAKGAVEKGWNAHAAFVPRQATASLIADFAAAGVQYHPLDVVDVGAKASRAPYLKRVTRTWRLLKKVQPSAVLLQLCGMQYGLGPMLACAVRGVPAAVIFQMVRDGRHFLPPQRWVRAIARLRRQRYVAVSENNRRVMADALHMNAAQIAVIPNGANPEKFSRNPEERLEIRQRLCAEVGVHEDAILLLTVGRLSEQKGHDLLVTCLPDLEKEFPKIHCLWAGEGPARERLESDLRDRDALDRVTFLGRRDDIPELLNAADLLVHPARFEGQPFSLLEAMAAGLPIISTQASGIPEILQHGRHALLSAVDDYGDLQEHLAYALRNPETMRDMAVEARKRLDGFTEARMVQNTLALCNELAHHKGDT
jgi:glycosyltransferase involved in cell wall biosynthesis